MKRRLFLLLGASTLTVTSLVGFTVASPAPASATVNPFVSIGYIIQCLTPETIVNNLATCLIHAVEQLVQSLSLPPIFGNFGSFGNSAPNSAPVLPGSNAPTLNLPGNVSSILKTLPTPLQTNPVASAPTIKAPISQLIPTLPSHSASSGSSFSLPKVPTLKPINFLNASDTKAAGSPLSTTDAAGVAALAVLGMGAVVVRRRAAAAS